MKRAFSRKNLWEALPLPVRSRLGAALGIIPPQFILGSRFRQTLSFLHDAQSWPCERSREYQIGKLQRTCALAYERTRYYREIFDRAGFRAGDLKSPEDIEGLPLIDKHTLREHMADMCTRDPNRGGVDTVSTGGSSGEPLRFLIDAGRSAVEYAYLVAGWERAGYQTSIPQAVFRGMLVSERARGLRHQYDPILRRHYYSNFHMSDENMGRYLEHLGTIGPCFLHVYPSSVTTLARFIQRRGIRPPANIRGILAGSENVYPEDRTVVESVFGLRLFSWYGHSEKLVLGAECEHSSDYHIWPTYGYFELLDEGGRPVRTPGQRGEIVGTGFINTIVPFVRYRTGDEATYVGDRCPHCGREQVIISEVRGHNTQEMLVAADGSMISWTALNMHDDTFLNVRQFQFRQEKPGVAVLRIVAGDGFGEEARRRIARNLAPKLSGRIQFDVELVEAIPLTRSGKSIYVDQRISTLPSAASTQSEMSAN